MRGTVLAVTSILVMVLGATTAKAAVLYSPPFSGATGHIVACRVTNASTAARVIKVDLLQAGGSVAVTTNDITVQPGGFLSATLGGNFIFSCRVTVDGGKNNVRALISIERNITGSDFVTDVAVPFE